VDSLVVLSFGIAFVLISTIAMTAIVNRFPADVPLLAVIASSVVGIALSACGVQALVLWANLIEIARIGNAHMSYRADRLPWNHHGWALFVSGLVLFAGTAAVRYSRERIAPRAHASEFHRAFDHRRP
jgi:hypothetical protein